MWWNRLYSGWGFRYGVCIALLLSGCTKTGYVGTNTCLACHDGRSATDVRLHLEGKHAGISCETCHGPGALHVRNGGRGGLLIANPALQTFDDAVSLCAECHESQAEGFANTAHAFEKAAACHVCHDVHTPGGLNADRDENGFATTATFTALCSECHTEAEAEFQLSGHVASDAANCGSCHNLHAAGALRAPVETNAVCQQCHGGAVLGFDTEAAIDFHTGAFHPVDPAGTGASRCTGCHMPAVDRNGNFGAGFDHSLATIAPAATNDAIAAGALLPPANSCSGTTGCHDGINPAGGFHDPADMATNEQLQVLYESIGQIVN
ncbi:MAG: hypothetical protein HYV27_23590 [Candidatus Hydrogenedentes bacterium]|nr:hypothetical protein [Candidatus Hydrogenedentota bacterium]